MPVNLSIISLPVIAKSCEFKKLVDGNNDDDNNNNNSNNNGGRNYFIIFANSFLLLH